MKKARVSTIKIFVLHEFDWFYTGTSSSHEENFFGDFLEDLAVFIAQGYGGRKSSATGIDLELKKNGTHYLVSIKSGEN